MKYLFPVVSFMVIFSNMALAQSYYSKTPVDTGSFAIPAAWTANWKELKNENTGHTYQVIANPNKTGMLQIVPNMGSMIPAIASKAGDKIFISLYNPGGAEQPEGYYIFRVDFVGDGKARLVPLRSELSIPAGNSLKEYLQKADTNEIDAGYARWFGNIQLLRAVPLNKEGRTMNINKKTSR